MLSKNLTLSCDGRIYQTETTRAAYCGSRKVTSLLGVDSFRNFVDAPERVNYFAPALSFLFTNSLKMLCVDGGPLPRGPAPRAARVGRRRIPRSSREEATAMRPITKPNNPTTYAELAQTFQVVMKKYPPQTIQQFYTFSDESAFGSASNNLQNFMRSVWANITL